MASARTPRPIAVERDLDHERLWRKQRLALAFRIFGRFGFDEGVAGHITARDPERADEFWVNPFGMSFKQITVDDLIRVDHHGEVVEGDWPVNRAAFAIHSSIHAARPDVVAAAHSHSKFGRAYSALGRTLEPLTQDSCIFHGDHVLFDDYRGVVDDPEEGKRIAHALGAHKAAILRNHGLLTVGRSVEEAIFWYVTMERTCEVELLARAAGPVVAMDDDVAEATAQQVGGHLAGWFCAQPIFDWIAQVEPDAFGTTQPVD
ncbi:MAG: class II aldolase/adducin family protein [Acidimicrobiales bacterium]|nr:class II aldolase/adducin family protein [Acidimicrobiales bacterium]HRW39433.1 class II aldolase/adducin family protein [Aquihabitans sp.]